MGAARRSLIKLTKNFIAHPTIVPPFLSQPTCNCSSAQVKFRSTIIFKPARFRPVSCDTRLLFAVYSYSTYPYQVRNELLKVSENFGSNHKQRPLQIIPCIFRCFLNYKNGQSFPLATYHKLPFQCLTVQPLLEISQVCLLLIYEKSLPLLPLINLFIPTHVKRLLFHLFQPPDGLLYCSLLPPNFPFQQNT